MQLFDYSTQINRLGGTRAGANMAVLRFDHPDILEFVRAKHDPARLTSFNLSVMATDDFMVRVDRGLDVALTFPGGTPAAGGRLSARALIDEIVEGAWRTGDPGMLFYDRINAANPTPELGPIEATNPCGEQPLLAHESCNLGSINVARFARNGAIDYDALGTTIGHAVHFLDNVLDANFYPVEAIREVTLGNRKVGLGIMGFADLLVQLQVPYASPAALSTATDLMQFVQTEGRRASAGLAAARGSYPAQQWRSRSSADADTPRRNACVTSIAPTGTISMIANCSSGIEPFFALSFRREVIGTTRIMEVQPGVTAALMHRVPDVDSTLADVRRTGRLPAEAPADLRALFATAHEIAPEWHVRIQAAFQRHTDTGVSKTINLKAGATAADVAAAYRLAFESGCKGVTVFRDGCKAQQVLRAGVVSEPCPECGEPLAMQSGCSNCASCGYSVCTI
jgi:ribonucleoside-diphosphate reductase alpha chain